MIMIDQRNVIVDPWTSLAEDCLPFVTGPKNRPTIIKKFLLYDSERHTAKPCFSPQSRKLSLTLDFPGGATNYFMSFISSY